MTQINFDFGHPSADGVAVLAGELVHVVPTGRFKVGKRIVVRDSFDVRLSETGTATIDVTPTDNTFAYEVTVGESPDAWRFVRCVQVPNSSTPVAFADLVDVDASTLAPAPNSGTALTYLLASSLSEAQAMSTANPGQMVFYPEGSVKTVASQILEDLTDARATVEAQSTVAAQAANAARAASDASQAASAQVTAVADSISKSKTVVESHASEALTAIDEAVKQVRDKASDVSGEDRTDTMPTDSTDSASSQEV
nr:MAG TPA: hypothetical protein [Caudoviricetes sp.]